MDKIKSTVPSIIALVGGAIGLGVAAADIHNYNALEKEGTSKVVSAKTAKNMRNISIFTTVVFVIVIVFALIMLLKLHRLRPFVAALAARRA